MPSGGPWATTAPPVETGSDLQREGDDVCSVARTPGARRQKNVRQSRPHSFPVRHQANFSALQRLTPQWRRLQAQACGFAPALRDEARIDHSWQETTRAATIVVAPT